jgi:hypothetical protein
LGASILKIRHHSVAFFVPNTLDSETFSFLGVSFSTPEIARVRIISGNIALAAGATDKNGDSRDVIAMDDFIFGEPVPEAGTLTLLIMGAAAVVLSGWRRKS